MKRKLFVLIAALLTGSLAAPAMAQLLPERSVLPPTVVSTRAIVSEMFPSISEIVGLRDGFNKALYEDEAQKLAYIVELYPKYTLLKLTMQNKKGEKVLPICVAVEEGRNKVLEYMLKRDPKQVKEYTCPYPTTPLEVAVANKQADSMLLLLAHGALVYDYDFLLIRTAQAFNDENTLRKLVPALLKAGALVHAQHRSSDGLLDIDAFYAAAEKKNDAFIKVLREELKKRNLPVVSKIRSVECEDRANPKRQKENLKIWKQKGPGLYLEKMGIPVEVDLHIVTRDCD